MNPKKFLFGRPTATRLLVVVGSVLAFVVGVAFFGVVGFVLGWTIFGNYFPNLVLFGYQGYEAQITLGLFLGAVLGVCIPLAILWGISRRKARHEQKTNSEPNAPIVKIYSLTLFLLGIGSFVAGPLASVPGVIFGWRLKNRGTMGQIGYEFCWIITGLFGAAVVLGFLVGVTFPLWRGYVR